VTQAEAEFREILAREIETRFSEPVPRKVSRANLPGFVAFGSFAVAAGVAAPSQTAGHRG